LLDYLDCSELDKKIVLFVQHGATAIIYLIYLSKLIANKGNALYDLSRGNKIYQPLPYLMHQNHKLLFLLFYKLPESVIYVEVES